MGLIITSVLIDAIGSLLLFAPGDIRYIFPLACAVLGAIGAVLIGIGMRKTGAIVVMISGVVSVPVGLLGVAGARQILEFDRQDRREERARRRRQMP